MIDSIFSTSHNLRSLAFLSLGAILMFSGALLNPVKAQNRNPAQASFSRQSVEGDYTIFRDSAGIFQCVYDSKKNQFIQFVWTQDPYSRRVFAKFHSRRYGTKQIGPPQRRQTTVRVDLLKENCQKSRIYLKDNPENIDAKKIEAVHFFDESIFGFPVSEDMKLQFAKVMRGANVLFPLGVENAEDYLSRHSVNEFTYDFNRRITLAYGVGFAGQVYRGYLESKKANIEMKSLIVENATQKTSESWHPSNDFSEKQARLDSFFENRSVVLVKGLGHESAQSEELNAVPRLMRSLGAHVIEVKTSGVGSMRDNAKVVKSILLNELQKGRFVTLITLSKGSVEAYLAMAELERSGELQKLPGSIDSVVGFGAVFGHSYFLEKFTGFPEWIVVKKALKNFWSDIPHHGFKGLHELGSKKTMNEMRNEMFAHLPRDPIYLTFSAVPPPNGLAIDDWGREVQNSYIRPHFTSKNLGANDVYLEFPLTELPSTLAPNIYNLVIEGTHGSMLEGRFGSLELSHSQDRRAFTSAIFLSLAEKLAK